MTSFKSHRTSSSFSQAKTLTRVTQASRVRTFLPNSAAYAITNERSNLDIAILDVSSLHLHEQIIPKLLENLVYSISADGCLKDPIIVDKESLVVLDGVHRVIALQKLGIKRILVCLVDYNSPNIKVYSWCRAISGTSSIGLILSEVELAGITSRKVRECGESLVGNSPTVAALRFRHQTFVLNPPFKSLKEAFNTIQRLEERLKSEGLLVKHQTEQDALHDLQEGQIVAVLMPPVVSKSEIISTALSGEPFVYKATRHVIPFRPLRVNILQIS
jgi:hypothetical protein